MSSFGSLWRVKTRQHIRTMNSIATTTGPALATLAEAHRRRETRRLKARRLFHAQREAGKAVLLWKHGR
jgi:hypothetical protein